MHILKKITIWYERKNMDLEEDLVLYLCQKHIFLFVSLPSPSVFLPFFFLSLLGGHRVNWTSQGRRGGGIRLPL